jgi:hypothetical protein
MPTALLGPRKVLLDSRRAYPIEPYEPDRFQRFLLAHVPVEFHRQQRFVDRLADLHAGIEGLGRLLEDELDLACQIPARSSATGNRPSLEIDRTGARFEEANDTAPDSRLAGTAFTDKP